MATYRKGKNVDTCRQYCRISNDLQGDNKRAKSDFFESQINENIGKPRKLWQSLKKKIGYSYKSKSNAKIVLRIADKLCHDTLEIF